MSGVDVKELVERNRELKELTKTQALLIELQQRELNKLKAQLDQDSSNSHKPPSSDSPKARADRNRKKRKRQGSSCKRGGQPGHKGKHSGVAREVGKYFDSLWTFLDHEGLEPTNNTAERELRHPVILRKLSYGSQSERGLRFMERALSIRGTLRRQGRNFYQFLVALWTHQPTNILPDDLAPA